MGCPICKTAFKNETNKVSEDILRFMVLISVSLVYNHGNSYEI